MLPQTVTATIENCRYCLMCRHVCPVGHVTRMETFTPHGWGLTIASVERGLLSWNPDTVNVLYSCADCGTCLAHCVTQQALPDAISATRAVVAAQSLAPATVYDVHKALQEWGNPYEKYAPEVTKGQADIALFVGDDARYLWPSAVDNALKLLEVVGIKPVLIGLGRNNGYLAASLGFPETAKKLLQDTLVELKASGARTMLVLTPGDHYVFGSMLNDRLGGGWPNGVELKEVVSLLDGKFKAGELKLKASEDKRPYVYIDPTHALRICSDYGAARRLLAGVMPAPARELFWRKERTHPCGNGALQFTSPHISNHLTYARLADAQATGAQVIVTQDPGCLSHLNRHSGRFGLQVKDLYELLVDHLL